VGTNVTTRSADDIRKFVKEWVDAGKQKRPEPADIHLDKQDLAAVEAALAPYRRDPDPQVREMIIGLDYVASINRPGFEAKRAWVDHEVDPNEGNCDDSDLRLMPLTSDCFSDAAKAKLLDAYKQGLISPKLLGVAQAADAIPQLKAAVAKDGPAVVMGGHWYQRLALARMGDHEQVKACLDAIEAIPDPDERLGYLEVVDYIRQPEAIRVLIKYLNGEESTRDQGDVPPARYARYAMDALRDSLKDFPYHPLYDSRLIATDSDINACRKWAAEQTTFDIRR